MLELRERGQVSDGNPARQCQRPGDHLGRSPRPVRPLKPPAFRSRSPSALATSPSFRHFVCDVLNYVSSIMTCQDAASNLVSTPIIRVSPPYQRRTHRVYGMSLFCLDSVQGSPACSDWPPVVASFTGLRAVWTPLTARLSVRSTLHGCLVGVLNWSHTIRTYGAQLSRWSASAFSIASSKNRVPRRIHNSLSAAN